MTRDEGGERWGRSADVRLGERRIRMRRILRAQLYPRRAPVDLRRWDAPGEPVPFHVAAAAPFRPCAPGEEWGTRWGTTWFEVTTEIPADWTGERIELWMDLGFTDAIAGFQCEGLVYSGDGDALGGLEPPHRSVPVPTAARQTRLWVEAAANPDVAQQFAFTPTTAGARPDGRAESLYRLGEVFLGIRDESIWELVADLDAVGGLHEALASHEPRTRRLGSALSRALDVLEQGTTGSRTDPEAVSRAREILGVALAVPAAADAHVVHAVGHAHIDSAWLWPLRETRRKVARTFANVLALMDVDEDLRFVASSAQQWAWLKADHPRLFARVAARVAEGRFVPVGGQWVETDCMLPGAESLARQFVEGRRFFREEFGITPREVWVPDSFGYSAALPQIARLAGAEAMLTQKLSWNDTNRFPHHSFLWEALDGTRIFTHFPPADTYNAHVSAAELVRAERALAQTGEATVSLLPFGWGDGGGGPTEEMLASVRRMQDVQGAPRVVLSTPDAFFDAARAELTDPPVWVGELYLELHRGVGTSQQQLKRGNRRNERLLREAELWCTAASVLRNAPYPHDELRELWREVLLLQFHDILPGTSIAWVHEEAAERHARISQDLERLVGAALRVLAGAGEHALTANAGPFALDGAAGLSIAGTTIAGTPISPDGPHPRPVQDGDRIVWETASVRLTWTSGELTSVYDALARRELVPPGRAMAQPRLYRDRPARWDAWDIDEQYERMPLPTPVPRAARIEGNAVIVSYAFGTSTLEVRFRLASERGSDPSALEMDLTLDWYEEETLLKLDVPLALHALEIATEVQFGHVRRPLHRNTSWESARFEFVVQRWARVAEGGYGVALANQHTPSMSARHDVVDEGSLVTLSPSIARSPRYPDPASDVGAHPHRFSLVFGATVEDAVRVGYRLGVPVREIRGDVGAKMDLLVALHGAVVVIESVHLAPDGTDDVLVRCYEPLGERGVVTVDAAFDGREYAVCDLYGDPLETTDAMPRSPWRPLGEPLTIRAFEIVTLRLRSGGARDANDTLGIRVGGG